jgi:hypothetical protein
MPGSDERVCRLMANRQPDDVPRVEVHKRARDADRSSIKACLSEAAVWPRVDHEPPILEPEAI